MGCGSTTQRRDDVLPMEGELSPDRRNAIQNGILTNLAENGSVTPSEPESSSDSIQALLEEAPARAYAGDELPGPKPRLNPVRYRLGSVCGEGAFGTVFRAQERTTGLALAVKELKTEGGGESRLKAAEREVAFMTSLRHPNVVRIVDFRKDEARGRCTIVMEDL